jgi:hypothetical protein
MVTDEVRGTSESMEFMRMDDMDGKSEGERLHQIAK